jgi:hypothetical protein
VLRVLKVPRVPKVLVPKVPRVLKVLVPKVLRVLVLRVLRVLVLGVLRVPRVLMVRRGLTAPVCADVERAVITSDAF